MPFHWGRRATIALSTVALSTVALGAFGPALLALMPRAQAVEVAQVTGRATEPPCQHQVQQQLQWWGVVAPPRTQPGGADGGVVRHWPTATLGIWVVELNHAAGGASLVKTEPARMTRVEWSASCVAAETTRGRPRAPEPRFDDDDLRAVVESHGGGVIYLWSPHMPLSIDGIRSLRAAADARGLAVHAILDPAADRAFATTSLADARLPDTALRVADSVELTFRDVVLHAPSIQAYGGGQLRGSAFPGYHSTDEYGAFLDRVLAAPAAR